MYSYYVCMNCYEEKYLIKQAITAIIILNEFLLIKGDLINLIASCTIVIMHTLIEAIM